jgi:DNA/RNA-binding domain of Phe-tRNA-synthetase-like protein
MSNISLIRLATTIVLSAATTIVLAIEIPKVNAASLIQKDLFFGRNIAGGGEVSEAEFQTFVDREITPLFPDGLTIFDAEGQIFDRKNTLIEKKTKVVTIFAEDSPKSDRNIQNIVNAYIQQFQQQSLLQVTNEDDLKVAFGAGENIIDNDLTPELIQADLFFGRNIKGGGQVSEAEFQSFVDREITPRFPDGLTIFDADGQFLDSTDTLIQEPTKEVTLILEDTVDNERSIDEIITAYLQQFQQESVLLSVNEDIGVAFNAGENIIDNDLTPEPIEVNLFFGRNIKGGGEVSEAEFQDFVDREITPRFFNGSIIFDADGQFLDSSNTLIKEKTKGVTLILEDISENEWAIDEIITAYLQQFQQESVLLIVDEEVGVDFDVVQPPQSTPEPQLMSLFSLPFFLLLSKKLVKK